MLLLLEMFSIFDSPDFILPISELCNEEDNSRLYLTSKLISDIYKKYKKIPLVFRLNADLIKFWGFNCVNPKPQSKDIVIILNLSNEKLFRYKFNTLIR